MFPHLVKQEEFLTADLKQAYHAAGATVSKPGSNKKFDLLPQLISFVFFVLRYSIVLLYFASSPVH